MKKLKRKAPIGNGQTNMESIKIFRYKTIYKYFEYWKITP